MLVIDPNLVWVFSNLFLSSVVFSVDFELLVTDLENANWVFKIHSVVLFELFKRQIMLLKNLFEFL